MKTKRQAKSSAVKDIEDIVAEASANARRAPKEPTEAEKSKHEATHIPYRSWCKHCVRGRGRCKPHSSKRRNHEDAAIPKISMDYFFLGGEDSDANESPMFVMMDEERGNRYARMIDSKGLGEGGENNGPFLTSSKR